MTTTDWIGIVNIVATVAALTGAPIIALYVSGRLQQRSDAKKAKLDLFGTLVSLRHDAAKDEFIQTLNKIDIVFVDDDTVREAWSRYYVVLNDANFDNPPGWSFRDDRKRELLLAIVHSLNLRRRITTADILRTYIPRFAVETQMLAMYRRLLDLHNAQEELRRLNIAFVPWQIPMADPIPAGVPPRPPAAGPAPPPPPPAAAPPPPPPAAAPPR